ncbi:nephrocystin-3-like isoform X2 [Sycon ciliatum]|uniref:nephrocystin-3-like isoform X2 n=1 Tax=Sycon ciliatum TaxID=27933 RepID=UPI0031F61D48
MGAGSSSTRRQGQVIQASQITSEALIVADGQAQGASGSDLFKSSLERVDASLDCEVLESRAPSPSKLSGTLSKQSSHGRLITKSVSSTRAQSTDNGPTPTTPQAAAKPAAEPPASPKTKLIFKRSPSAASAVTQPPNISSSKLPRRPSQPSPDTRTKPPITDTAQLFARSPLQQQLAESEAQLQKKSEENAHLRNEIKLLQGVVAKLQTKQNAAADMLKDALERCKSIEMEKERVLTAFDAFRDHKEAEISALLCTKEELERRIQQSAQWHCGSCAVHGRRQEYLSDMFATPTSETAPLGLGEYSPGEEVVNPMISMATPPGAIGGATLSSQVNVAPVTDVVVCVSGCLGVEEEVKHFLERCTVLKHWCARNGCLLTLVNCLPSSSSAPQLVRCSTPSASQTDSVRAIVRQEIEHCDAFISFIAEDINRMTRDEVEGSLSKDGQCELCIFCFNNNRTSKDSGHPGESEPQQQKAAALLKSNRAYSGRGSDGRTPALYAAIEKQILKSSKSKIVNGDSVEERATVVFDMLDSYVQQVLGRTRSSSESTADLAEKVLKIDIDTDRRLDMFRLRKDAVQQSILKQHASYPLVPALEKYIDKLDEHVSDVGPLPPLLILGDPGSGKTTLLAHWLTNHQQSNRTQHILHHFVTSSASSTANTRQMTQRFVWHLMQWLGVHDYRNLDMCQIEEFPTLLDQVSSRQANGVVLVLDGIERIEDQSKLSWLLEPLPVETRVIVACSRDLCPLKWRTWPTLDVDALSARHTKTLLRHFMGPLHKLLVPDQEMSLSGEVGQTTSNPLFTVLLSRHLASDSDPSTLAVRIQSGLDCKSIHKLLHHIFDGLDLLITVPTDVLKKVFCLVYVSQDGVVQDDLLQLCDITWISWLRLRYILTRHLLIVVHGGTVMLNGPHVRSVVEELYLNKPEEHAEYRSCLLRQLISRFESGYRSVQLWEELVSLFSQQTHADQKVLERFLVDADVVLDMLMAGNCPLLLETWLKTGKEKRDIASICCKMAMEGNSQCDQAELYRSTILMSAVSSFAVEFLDCPTKGIALARQCLSIREDILDPDHPSVARALHCLATIHLHIGQVDTAVQLIQQATSITEDTLGTMSRQMADHFCLLGMIAKKQNRQDAAEQFQLKAISTLQEVAKSTVATTVPHVARPTVFGQPEFGLSASKRAEAASSLDTAKTLNQQAMLFYMQADYKRAETLFMEVLSMRKQVYGSGGGDMHGDVAQSLCNLGMLYTDMGRYSEAEPLLEQSISIQQQLITYHCW